MRRSALVFVLQLTRSALVEKVPNVHPTYFMQLIFDLSNEFGFNLFNLVRI